MGKVHDFVTNSSWLAQKVSFSILSCFSCKVLFKDFLLERGFPLARSRLLLTLCLICLGTHVLENVNYHLTKPSGMGCTHSCLESSKLHLAPKCVI